MLPKLIVLTIAIVGAFVHGIVGFFVWGFLGYIAIIAIGWILTFFSGGLLPKKLKDETVRDFIASYPDLVKKAYPENNVGQSSQSISILLETMYKKAIENNPSSNMNVAISKEFFLPQAMEVANSQVTEELKDLSHQLINFLKCHRLWYG